MNSNHESLSGMHDRLIRTGDGSYTLRSTEFDENMHSLSGAYEEARLKHVIPSRILAADTGPIAVLDVGLGLGYNILALLAELETRSYPGCCSVVSLEKEMGFLPHMDSVRFHDRRDDIYALIRRAYRHETAREGNYSIRVFFGDARQTVLSLQEPGFDAVFFDPFSPSRNPELWSVDFLREIARLMSNTGVLTTYSSAPQIRSALIEAGFIVGRGPSVGGKREGTLAAKGAVIDPLPEAEIAALMLNPRAVPYRDPTLAESRPVILGRRRDEIRSMKESGIQGRSA